MSETLKMLRDADKGPRIVRELEERIADLPNLLWIGADEIERLEARVKAANKLARAVEEHLKELGIGAVSRKRLRAAVQWYRGSGSLR